MTWDSGTISGFASLAISAQATLALQPDYLGTVTLDGVELDNYGAASWTGGIIAGAAGASMTNEPQATFLFEMPEVAPCCYSGLENIALDNFGMVNWSSGNLGAGDGDINNEPGATFDAESDGSLVGGTFNNLAGASVVVDNDNQGGTDFALAFNNDGSVSLVAGSLNLGQSVSIATSGGSFTGAPGTVLDFTSSQDFTATSTIDADAVIFSIYSQAVSLPDYDVAGDYDANLSTLIAIGAHVDFTGTVIGVGNSLDVEAFNQNAIANFDPSTPTIVTTGECTVSGTLTGTDSFHDQRIADAGWRDAQHDGDDRRPGGDGLERRQLAEWHAEQLWRGELEQWEHCRG